MKQRHHPYYSVHRWCNWCCDRGGLPFAIKFFRLIFSIGVVSTVSVITLLEFADTSDQVVDGFLEKKLQLLYQNRFAIVAWLLVIQSVCGSLAWILSFWVEKHPDRSKLKNVLNRVLAEHFPEMAAEHVYRATLFKYRRCWPFGRWLAVIERSHEVYLKRKTIFSVDPDRRCNNTGIAGESWFRAQSNTGGSFRLQLPDVRSIDDEKNGHVVDYKSQGFIDEREFSELNVRACFFRVTEIRRCGKVWGVLIVDTTEAPENPQSTQKHNSQTESLKRAADTITLLIE